MGKRKNSTKYKYLIMNFDYEEFNPIVAFNKGSEAQLVVEKLAEKYGPIGLGYCVLIFKNGFPNKRRYYRYEVFNENISKKAPGNIRWYWDKGYMEEIYTMQKEVITVLKELKETKGIDILFLR